MPEEEILEDEVEDVDEKPKGNPLALIVALLAFVAAVAAIALNVTSKPDLGPLEVRIKAVEQGVQANTDNIATVVEEQKAMDGNVEEMINTILTEREAEANAAAEEGETVEE